MLSKGKVLYIGGFELPDKNAAAHRVIGIAKGLKTIGYEVRFINALKKYSGIPRDTEYLGFSTFEYMRECSYDYLIKAQKAISIIKDENPTVVIAYNYPAVALNRIRKYCQANRIKCIADVTEWSMPADGTVLYKVIKRFDTAYRMKYVHKHMDAVIAISRFLYNFYASHVLTVLIPPTIDISDEKWGGVAEKHDAVTSFVYAGSPSAIKEKLDIIICAFEECLKTEKVVFNIVGITKKQFMKMYSWEKKLPAEIVFWGRLSHMNSIRIVKSSTWSIILRGNNRVVEAGFPTKLVESISCGTPIIANEFSNIYDYLDNSNSLKVDEIGELAACMCRAVTKKTDVLINTFDYHNYLNELREVVKV